MLRRGREKIGGDGISCLFKQAGLQEGEPPRADRSFVDSVFLLRSHVIARRVVKSCWVQEAFFDFQPPLISHFPEIWPTVPNGCIDVVA